MQDHEQGTPAQRVDYWNGYYAAARKRRQLPSQFAAFVAGELNGPHRVVEFGSGAGRDALFFAEHGHDVHGVDGSVEAVELCAEMAKERSLTARFTASAIDSPDLADSIGTAASPTVVYARFFVHAIKDDEESAFLAAAAAITGPGDRLAVEYRTDRDFSGTKVTDSHYRRFVRPTDFHANAGRHGFEVTYAVQGFGYAKYGDDDAFVARDLLVRS